MKLTRDGEIIIVSITDASELSSLKSEDYHVVVSDKYSEEFRKYPTKITYEIEIPENFDLILSRLNKKRRYNLKRLHRICSEKYDYKIEEEITRDDFEEFRKSYDSFIGSKELGDNRIDDTWFEEKSKDHILIKYFDKNDSRLAGETVAKRLPKTNKLSMSYGWTDEESKKLGIATYEVYILLEYCIEKSIGRFSYGQDDNLYGGHLSIGLHNFKTYFGATPRVTKSALIKGIRANEVALQNGPAIIFYTLDESESLIINKFNC